MITGDSFIFSFCNGFEDALNLYATSFLGPGGHQELFLEVEIQNSRHETRIFSIRLLYLMDLMDHKPSTRLGSQDVVLNHNPRQWWVWWNSERGQG